MTDWLTDLKFWCQTNAAKRRIACNPVDIERVQAAADEAGIADLVDIDATYMVPRGYAMATSGDDENMTIETGVGEDFFEALTVRKYI